MSAENVFRLIKNLIDRYKIDGLAFNDDSFLVDFKRVDRLCDLLLENKINIKWKASARVDAINRMSSEFIEKMKACGLSYFFVGIESGSNRILSLMNKGITKDDAIRANRKLAKHGIGAVYSFITGVPTETREEVFKTLDLADLLRNENPLAGISGFLPYGPLYGTPLYDKAVELGFKTPSSLEQWSFSTQEEIKRPYLSKKRDRELKYLFYLARLADTKTVIKYLQSRPVLCLLARLYMPIVRFRWRYRFLAFPLDIRLVEFLYLKGILT